MSFRPKQTGYREITKNIYTRQGEKELARLSLEFLDRYFADEYEIDSLVQNAPKSEKELKG